jgi:hypothetical protein
MSCGTNLLTLWRKQLASANMLVNLYSAAQCFTFRYQTVNTVLLQVNDVQQMLISSVYCAC